MQNATIRYAAMTGIYDVTWEMMAVGCEAPEEYTSSKADKEKQRRSYEPKQELVE